MVFCDSKFIEIGLTFNFLRAYFEQIQIYVPIRYTGIKISTFEVLQIFELYRFSEKSMPFISVANCELALKILAV